MPPRRQARQAIFPVLGYIRHNSAIASNISQSGSGRACDAVIAFRGPFHGAMGMQMTDWNPAGSGGSQEPPTRRSHTKLWIGLGGILALVVVIVVVAAVVLLKGPNVPAGTPNQYQLREILPSSEALPSGWRVTYRPQPLGTYITAGSLPPRPINACLDFNNGFDLGIAGDTFVSLASETARNGSGFLRIDALGVLPGDAAKAISAVKSWAGQCSAYTDGPVSYTVAAAPVAGLGSESLNVITTQQAGTAGLNVFDNDTLVARGGNSLIAIECIAPPSLLPKSLARLAPPLVRKVPPPPPLWAGGCRLPRPCRTRSQSRCRPPSPSRPRRLPRICRPRSSRRCCRSTAACRAPTTRRLHRAPATPTRLPTTRPRGRPAASCPCSRVRA